MRILKFLVLLAAVLAAAAAFTRPGPREFDRMVGELVRDRIATSDIGDGGDLGPTIALAACKLRPSDCVRLVREALRVEFDEGVFVTVADVKGFDRETRCLGIFGRFFCRQPVAG